MYRGGARSSGGYNSSRGRSPAHEYQQFDRRKIESQGCAGKTSDEPCASGGGWSRGRGRSSWPHRNNSFYPNDKSKSVQAYVPKKPSPVVKVGCLQVGAKQEAGSRVDHEADSETSRLAEVAIFDSKEKPVGSSTHQKILDEGSFISGGHKYQDMDDGTKLPCDLAIRLGNVSLSSQDDSSAPSSFGRKDQPSSEEDTSRDKMKPFDIFLEKKGSSFMLKPSLLAQNKERRNAMKQSTEGQNGIVLRCGMVLLKNYLSINDQVMILKTCRQLGLGQGGFYQPGYRDGAVLHLKLMCLGKNWDPETCQYGDTRPVDGAKPPKIPIQFNQFVEKVIKESRTLVARNSKKANGVDEIPSMSPDICLVNFYTSTGRLGLHQDKDESEESLKKGLPVVSFSIGDSAEFLYGDQRDADKAEKVILESGDVLLFGGKARKVFHGVKSILPNTVPKTLLQETNLRPGRVNLTFRQY